MLVSKGSDAGANIAVKDKQLDEARTKTSDLRFSLEEAVRRAELAEEAKVGLERELREEIRRKQNPSRRRATSDLEDVWHPAREGARPTMPAQPRPTSSSTSGMPSRALRSAWRPVGRRPAVARRPVATQRARWPWPRAPGQERTPSGWT